MATQWTAGLTDNTALPAATLNTIGAAWENYTPAWTSSGTQPAIGNGILEGRYTRINKLLIVSFILVAGSTTTFGTGNYRFSMPVSIVQGQANMGWGVVFDASASYLSYNINLALDNTATVVELYTAQGITPVGATYPITFANGDQIRVSIVGQAA
jgi:hypothetical protein